MFQDMITIHTGQDTLKNLGKVCAYKKQSNYKIWGTEKCNRVRGSDGLQFPPKLVSERKSLELFVSFFCRSLTLEYEKEVRSVFQKSC